MKKLLFILLVFLAGLAQAQTPVIDSNWMILQAPHNVTWGYSKTDSVLWGHWDKTWHKVASAKHLQHKIDSLALHGWQQVKDTLDFYVLETRTINGYDLSADRTLAASDISPTADRRYVTDAEKANLHAPGSDNQDLSHLVPKTTTVNGHALNTNVTVSNSDVGLGNVTNDAQVKRIEMGANNGVATLDVGGKVPMGQLPASLMIYKGTWSPLTNSPALTNGTGVSGWVYKASMSGTTDFGAGPISFYAGDFVIYNGTAWERSVGTDNVVSVNGQQGVVTLSTSHINEGTNKYYTDARVSANTDVANSKTHIANDGDLSANNEFQTISKSGSTVTLSNSGGSFTDENTTYSAGSGIALNGTTFSNTGVLSESDPVWGAAKGNYPLKAGNETITGAWNFSGAALFSDDIRLMNITGGLRWIFRTTDTETGLNTGSNFQLLSRTDAGGYLDVPLTINRASGAATFSSLSGSDTRLVTASSTGQLGTKNTADFTGYVKNVADVFAINGETMWASASGASNMVTTGYNPYMQGIQISVNNDMGYKNLLAFGYDKELYINSQRGGVWNGWKKIWHDGNLTLDLINNTVPKWDATNKKFVNSLVSDDGTGITIGGDINAGNIYAKNGYWGGAFIAGSKGSLADLALLNSDANYIMYTPTGTRDASFAGSVSATEYKRGGHTLFDSMSNTFHPMWNGNKFINGMFRSNGTGNMAIWGDDLGGDPNYGTALYLTNDIGSTQSATRLRATYNGVGMGGKPNFAIDRATDSQAYGSDPSGLTYTNSLTINGGNGYVGLGTTTPWYALDIKTTGVEDAQIALRNTSTGNAGVYFDASNGDLSGSDYAWIGQYNDLSFSIKTEGYAGNISLMPKNGAGNVGVGTTNPISKLHIHTTSWDKGGNIPLVNITNLDVNATDGNALLVRGGANDALSKTFEVQDYNGNSDFYVTGLGDSYCSRSLTVGTSLSDYQFNINSNGRYSALSFLNVGTLKSQIYWDNTANELVYNSPANRFPGTMTGTSATFNGSIVANTVTANNGLTLGGSINNILSVGNGNEIWGRYGSNGVGSFWINYRSYDETVNNPMITYIGSGKGSSMFTFNGASNTNISHALLSAPTFKTTTGAFHSDSDYRFLNGDGSNYITIQAANSTIFGNATSSSLKVTTGAGNGKIATSDASGNLLWKTSSEVGIGKVTVDGVPGVLNAYQFQNQSGEITMQLASFIGGDPRPVSSSTISAALAEKQDILPDVMTPVDLALFDNTVYVEAHRNGFHTVSSSTTITLASLVNGAQGNVKLVYTGSAAITIAVPSGYSLSLSPTIKNVGSTMVTRTSGRATISYWICGNDIFINGTFYNN